MSLFVVLACAPAPADEGDDEITPQSEAALERGERVLRGVTLLILGGFARARVLVVGVEVPLEMDVGIDPPGHEGEAAEIMSGRSRRPKALPRRRRTK